MTYTPIEGKVALITGAGAGIGAGIAERFSEAGASVVIFDVNGDSAAEMSRKIDQIRPGCSLAVQGDVSNEDEVKSAVEKAAAKFGTVYILVNNS